MKTRLISFVFATLFIMAAPALAENHVQANNCEIFIDQVGAYKNPNSSPDPYISFYIKTLNDRLDGEIVEVGFRNRAYGQNHYQDPYGSAVEDWINIILRPFLGSRDYFELHLHVSYDFSIRSRTIGAFYVKTDKNTYYWAKAQGGDDFSVNSDWFRAIMNVIDVPGGNYSPIARVGTQRADLSYFNPNRCY